MDQFIRDMQAEYKRKAKYADAKLRKLEKRAQAENDPEYLRYSYSRAQRDIKTYGGNNRFDIKPSSDPVVLQQMLSDVQRFLSSDTSGVAGFNRIQKSRVDKFNASLGTNFTRKEFTQLMETGIFDMLSQQFGFGYRTAVRIAKQLMKNKKNIANRTQKISAEVLTNMLRKYKYRSDPGLYDIVQGRL